MHIRANVKRNKADKNKGRHGKTKPLTLSHVANMTKGEMFWRESLQKWSRHTPQHYVTEADGWSGCWWGHHWYASMYFYENKVTIDNLCSVKYSLVTIRISGWALLFFPLWVTSAPDLTNFVVPGWKGNMLLYCSFVFFERGGETDRDYCVEVHSRLWWRLKQQIRQWTDCIWNGLSYSFIKAVFEPWTCRSHSWTAGLTYICNPAESVQWVCWAFPLGWFTTEHTRLLLWMAFICC